MQFANENRVWVFSPIWAMSLLITIALAAIAWQMPKLVEFATTIAIGTGVFFVVGNTKQGEMFWAGLIVVTIPIAIAETVLQPPFWSSPGRLIMVGVAFAAAAYGIARATKARFGISLSLPAWLCLVTELLSLLVGAWLFNDDNLFFVPALALSFGAAFFADSDLNGGIILHPPKNKTA